MGARKLNEAETSLLALLPEGAARQRFAEAGLPNRRDEAWRWSDMRAALSEPKELSTDYKSDIETPLIEAEGLTLTFLNGVLQSVPEKLPEGISLHHSDPMETNLLSHMADAASALAAPVAICIDAPCKTAVIFRYISDGKGIHGTRVQMHITDGAEAKLIELHEGQGEFFANGVTEMFVSENATVHRTIFAPEMPTSVQVHSSLALLMTNATYHQTIIGFGGKLARFETRVQHGGANASATLNGVSLLAGRNHLDHTTLVDHNVAACETHELYKSAITGRARGVFQGKFFVKKDAQQTDAKMAHHALLLSDTAEVRAKPELEIYADDVECAHGNTAGALDENAIFYMRQRGLSEAQARAILVEAFAGEVLEQIADEALRSQIEAHVSTWMGAQL